MKMSDNPAKHEVLTIIYVKDCFLSAYVFFLIIPLIYCKQMVQNNNE